MNRNRVVVTGAGVVAPNAIGREEFWRALAAGQSGISRISTFDVSRFSTKIAGQVKDFNPDVFMPRREWSQMGRQMQFAVAAALLAIRDAGLGSRDNGELSLDDYTVFIGTSNPAYDLIEQEVVRKFFAQGKPAPTETWALKAIDPFAVAANVCLALGTRSNARTISTSCTAGLNSIGHAFAEIRNGNERLVLAGSSDSAIVPSVFWCFCAAGIMSSNNEEPERASRPFDLTRDGGVLSEGAAVLVLEELHFARSRGATILCEILGYGETAMGTNPLATREGMASSMRSAMRSAHIEPIDVDLISAHAPSDPHTDVLETEAIKSVFGKAAFRIPVVSIKSMIGNPQSAAGPLQVVGAMLALTEGIIHPTINYYLPDPRCDLDCVPNKHRRNDVRIAMINSHGINGTDATLVIGTAKEGPA